MGQLSPLPSLIQEVGVGRGAVEGMESRVSVTQVHFHLLRQILHPAWTVVPLPRES